MSREVWKPNVTVAAVIEKDGQFLVVEEKSNGNLVFNQPAGHLEEGESLINATIRETLEETAWTFRPEFCTGIYRYTAPEKGVTYLRVCFSGSCDSHDPTRQLDEGIVAAHWLSREELAEQSDKLRSPMVLRCIDDYLRGNRFSLDALVEFE